jgi:tetratricopeptide (TPR) repeat protein
MAWMAGTFPYMAPEQLAAMMGTPTPLDGRCDIYAFGIMLHELLTGRYPFPARGPVRGMLEHLLEERRRLPIDLRRWNPAVSPALESIVRRCLEVDAERRYQSARELQEDLECQRTHQRLRHAPEPSWKERLWKWTRRNPRTTVAGVVGNCAVVLLTSLAVLLIARDRQMDRLRELEMERVKAQHAGERALSVWRLFQQDMKTAQFALYTRTHEADQLDAGVALGYRLLAGYGILNDPAWQDSPLVRMLPQGDRAELTESAAELLLLVARAELLRHTHLGDTAARHAALTRARILNERAEACSKQAAASPALWRQRAELCALLGRSDESKFCRGQAEALPLLTAHDHYWLASDHVAAGRLREALPLLQQATHLEPQNFWAWFVLANGYDRLGQDRRAEGCYGSCIALAPGFAWSYFNRGLAFLRQQDYRLACADFDQSLRLRPDDPDAHLNRALARQGLRQYREADDDLTQALNLSGPATRLFFLRSRVRDQLGDKGGAHHDYQEGLRTPPADEKSWLARGFAHLGRDPEAALGDFEEALRLNPRSAAGMQNKAHVLAEKLGRTEEALRVLDRAVELYPESAQARGGRGVLQARLGKRAAAHRDAEETLILEVTPARQYQVACIYALTARQQPDDRLQALQLLSSALRAGYGLHLLETDADLNAIRDLPDFRRLVEAARTLRPAPPTAQAKNS